MSRTVRFALSAIVLALGLMGCSGDNDPTRTIDTGTDATAGEDQGRTSADTDSERGTTPNVTSEVDTTGPVDFAPEVTDEVTPDIVPDESGNHCDQIPICPEVGTDCAADQDLCAEGCMCVGIVEIRAVCSQLCIPEECEHFCREDEICSQLYDRYGHRITLDDGTWIGACQEVDVIECDEITACSAKSDDCTSGGSACGESESCVCVDVSASESQCHQLCLVGTCDEVCERNETCRRLLDSERNPRVQADGTELGACMATETGEQSIYEYCDAEYRCQPGLICMGITETDGWCTQTCTGQTEENPVGDCPASAHEGGVPECFLTVPANGSDVRYCGYRCDGEGPCPTGMSCFDFGDEVGVCEYD